jgi:hypothetical protein
MFSRNISFCELTYSIAKVRLKKLKSQYKYTKKIFYLSSRKKPVPKIKKISSKKLRPTG